MKLKKGVSVLLLTAATLLALFGCSAPAGVSSGARSGDSSAPAGNASGQPAQQAPDAFPIALTDAAGREVVVTQEPQRLVSGYYITTSMLIALGQQDKIVGVEAKADTRPIYSLAAPELLDLPNVGTAKSFDLEGCAALHPDLVVLPLKLKDSAAALEELGIPVLTVNPENLSLLEETLRLLGAATGSAETAESLLAFNRETSDFLEQVLAQAERPRVYLAGNSSYLSTAGAKMYQNALIKLGGGENVAAELEDSYWSQVSYEQLIVWNPQVILIASDADYSKDDLLSDPQLAGVDAIENGQVYAMPSTVEAWDSPVPGALVGSRWTASVLHEDRYSFESFQTDAAAFYQEFYHIALDPSLLTK